MHQQNGYTPDDTCNSTTNGYTPDDTCNSTTNGLVNGEDDDDINNGKLMKLRTVCVKTS